MKVVPENVLLDLLTRCLRISQDVLALLAAEASQPVEARIFRKYSELIGDLQRQKRDDSPLADESWNWIWDARPGISHIQLYGRLAWLNYNLHSLL
jgi:hypothetical protein